MAVDVRPCADLDEYLAAMGAIFQYFGRTPTTESAEQFARNLPLERMLVARDDGKVVGGAGTFPFELSVPGGSVRAAGVSVVGVHPTHRRRGVLTTMMRTQLDDVRERGEPVAMLWSSEETIYGRFGFGMASLHGEIALPREHAAYARPLERGATTRLVEPTEALELFPPIYERAWQETPGMFRRTREWWETRVLVDPEDRRGDGGPKRLAVVELDGVPEGYATYRHHFAITEGVSSGKVHVIEAVGATPAATAATWRYLLDIDWSATVTSILLPVDHPLFFLLAEPRRMRFRVGDAIWIRLVDVGAALSARAYAADGAITFDVEDAFCPWNVGRWRLEAGRAERIDAAADIRCDVTALGSVYLGGFTFGQLARAGRVEELRTGALARADEIFRSERAPWCPEIF